MVKPIPLNKIAFGAQRLAPNDVFLEYPWIKLKNQITSTLTKVGNYCSLIIGAYSIIVLIKGTYDYLAGICKVKKVARTKTDYARYLWSPVNFLLARLPEESKKGNDLETNNLNTLSELQKLNKETPKQYPGLD